MAEIPPQPVPVAPLADLLAWWKAAGVRGMIIGGLANYFVGRPRATRDVDAVVRADDADLPKFLDKGTRFGFVQRIPDALSFAAQSNVLLLHHRESGIDIDISLAYLPFELEALERTIWREVEGQ